MRRDHIEKSKLTRAAIRRVMGRLAAAAVLSASVASCTTGVTQGQSNAYMIIDAFNGASGAKPTEFSGALASDVLTNNGIFEDLGRVVLRLALKDPGSTESPSTPTTSNFITVNRYSVKYFRTDGRNTPGVDVPYAFDGGVTGTVGTAGITLVMPIVRVQAKLESPLKALAGGGGQLAISTIAEITLYGKDQVGRDVSVSGNLSVNFADWADPDPDDDEGEEEDE